MLRKCIFLLIFLLSLTTPMVHAGAQEDAHAALEKFFAAFTLNNGATISTLFTPDALFYGTTSRELVTQPESVRRYFDNALLRGTALKATLLASTANVLNDNTVAISGAWQIERTVDGKTGVNGPLRVSVVMVKRGERWLIAQFHNSARPAAPN